MIVYEILLGRYKCGFGEKFVRGERRGLHTLTSTANLLANMMAAFRSRSESNTSMNVRFLCATQYMLRPAASPPPRAPHNCSNQCKQISPFKGDNCVRLNRNLTNLHWWRVLLSGSNYFAFEKLHPRFVNRQHLKRGLAHVLTVLLEDPDLNMNKCRYIRHGQRRKLTTSQARRSKIGRWNSIYDRIIGCTILCQIE